jgi:type I restriction enzyme S subunit
LTIQTGEVGITTIVPKKLEGSNCHALIITRFKQEIIFPKFYSYYFNSSFYRNQLKEIETGTTMKHINVRDMAILQVLIPPLPEQKAIAKILTKMDEEIEALEKKRDKYKKIKQGMMSVLLTGRIRLM